MEISIRQINRTAEIWKEHIYLGFTYTELTSKVVVTGGGLESENRWGLEIELEKGEESPKERKGRNGQRGGKFATATARETKGYWP